MKKRNNKTKYLLILLLLIAVGYAAIATTLKINGTSTIKSAKWDVYWENPQVLSGSVTNTAPTLSESDTKATFNVTLNEPGDHYEFTIDAVNNGSLDAKIDTNGIVKQVKNSSGEVVNPTILKYEVTNNDQEHTAIQEGHILAKKSGNTPTKETYRVRVEYRNDEGINPSDLDDSNDLVFTIEFSVKYVQGPKVNNTPSNPYATDFSGTYEYCSSEYTCEIDDENWQQELIYEKGYFRKNTLTNSIEICGVWSSGTICLASDENGYYDAFGSTDSETGDYIVTGYVAGKKEEFESKGLTCDISEDEMYCYEDYYADYGYISNDGYVNIYNAGCVNYGRDKYCN